MVEKAAENAEREWVECVYKGVNLAAERFQEMKRLAEKDDSDEVWEQVGPMTVCSQAPSAMRSLEPNGTIKALLCIEMN